MMRTDRISDFKIAEYLLRLFCKEFDTNFIDLPVVFKDNASGQIDGGIIFISNKGKLSQSLFQIVTAYLNNSEFFGPKLDNDLKISLINLTASVVRDFTYSKKALPDAFGALPASLKLNRDGFVWLAMRNIICPSFQKAIINIPVVAIKSDSVDGAKLVVKDELKYMADEQQRLLEEIKTSFIIMNMEVENYAARSAFLLFEAIRGHELDPRHVAKDLLLKDELSERFAGLVKISFVNTDDINDFIFTFGILAELSNIETDNLFTKASIGEKVKTSQSVNSEGLGGGSSGNSSHSSFWEIGLIEKMLQPSRGQDYSIYWKMKPFTDRLWAKIEEEKRNRGMKELPLEVLLRIQSEQYQHDPTLITQALLADNRVW